MPKKKLALEDQRAPGGPPAVHTTEDFELAQREARAISESTLVPAVYQKSVPNCLIALDMARRLGAGILMVCQNLYVVQGRPGWSAKFLVASFNQSGRFSSIRYRWQGTEGKDDWGCRAYATELANGQEIVGPLVTIGLAKKEGWYQKNGSKWQTIPELMCAYRAAAWLINTHAPEISMGLLTSEELGDIIDVTPEPSRGASTATASAQQTLREKYPPKSGNGAKEAEQPAERAQEPEAASRQSTIAEPYPCCGGLTEHAVGCLNAANATPVEEHES